jgi:branched-chain amino acid transport system ATP-binding protein
LSPTTPKSSDSILEVRNVETVYHGVVRVLRGVSLAVPRGSVVALLGPNGAGKTTTLRAITGLLDIHEGRITKGSIRFDGEDLSGLKPPQIVRRGMAQVMEGRRIFPELTVEENLFSGAWTATRQQVAEGLEDAYTRFPILGERRRQAAGYLSGGEQQMLAIGRALMSKPKLLLLDEPSLGLAPKIVSQVGDLVRQLNSEGMSILLVEQNAMMALELSSHGYILETGKVVKDGSSEELRADDDIREFYLGLGGGDRKDYRRIKHYRRRKRWLS